MLIEKLTLVGHEIILISYLPGNGSQDFRTKVSKESPMENIFNRTCITDGLKKIER